MSESELNRQVARATGEFVEKIRQLGFHLESESGQHPPQPSPRVIDWDDRSPAFLSNVLGDDDWPGRVEPLHSWDEERDDDLLEEPYVAAA